MNHSPLWTLLVVCGWASACAAQEPAFRFSKEIDAPSLQQDELLSVVLDADVYEATRVGLPDLRLFDAAGEAVPFLVRKARASRSQTVRETWTARQPSVRPLADGGLEITVRLDKDDPRPEGLRLVTPLRDFEQRVRVEASADGRQWEPLGEETVLFDYSRYMDARNDTVTFPETPLRHFRVTVDDVTLEQESELLELTRRLRGVEETERTERVTVDRRPFRVERVEFSATVERSRSLGDATTTYPIAGFQVEQSDDGRRTTVLVDTRREPLTSFTLQTPARNFSRRVAVEVEDPQDTDGWRNIGEATLSRIDFKSFKREQLAFSFPESRHARYRLVVDNRDSPSLVVNGVTAEGHVDELVFLASPDRQYRLDYGSEDADPPSHDTATIRELLQKGFAPVAANLGEQQAREVDAVPAAFEWPKLLNNRLLLGTVAALLVALLAWGLYHAAKRVDKLPRE